MVSITSFPIAGELLISTRVPPVTCPQGSTQVGKALQEGARFVLSPDEAAQTGGFSCAGG